MSEQGMTRNARRAAARRTANAASVQPPVSETRIEPQTRSSRKIHRSDVPALMAHDTPRRPKPRNTWQQRGWSDTSPFYWNMTTIDRRWDK